MTTTAKANQASEAEAGDICILDMGEHKRKNIKRLRKGKGKLLAKVERAVAELQDHGTLDSSAQVVIVVVKEEMSLAGLFKDD